MKRSLVAVAAAVLIFGSMAGASAQGGGGRGQGRGGFGGGFGGGGLFMLRMPEVQKELKMTDAQVGKLEGKQTEVRQAMQELFQNGGGGGGGQGGPNPEMMQKMQAIQTKAVADILDMSQQKRLKQLELQQQGPNALANPDVQKDLGLTEDQKTKIKGIQDASRQEMMGLFQGGGFQDLSPEERQQLMTKMQTMRKASGDKMTALLTAAQKTKLTELQGAPFKFPEFGGRPGGAGRPPQH
jgi:hypothetical protein